MEKISKLTRRKLFNKKIEGAANAALVCYLAKEIIEKMFNNDFCKNIEIISFRNNNLYIKTTSAIYSQEIRMKQDLIVCEIKKKRNDVVVEKICFK